MHGSKLPEVKVRIVVYNIRNEAAALEAAFSNLSFFCFWENCTKKM